MWTMQASQLEEPEGVLLGPTVVVAATLEVSIVINLIMGSGGELLTLSDDVRKPAI